MALFLIAMELVINNVTLPLTNDGFATVVKHLVDYHNQWNETTSAQILSAFPAHKFKTASERFVSVATDLIFRCGTRSAARTLSGQGVRTYTYLFDYQGPKYVDPASLKCELDAEVKCGVAHAVEVPYVFGNLGDPTAGQLEMSEVMQGYWTNFAKYGDPNGNPTGGEEEDYKQQTLVEWPQFEKQSDQYLILAQKVVVDQNVDKEACDFLDSLPSQGVYPDTESPRTISEKEPLQ